MLRIEYRKAKSNLLCDFVNVERLNFFNSLLSFLGLPLIASTQITLLAFIAGYSAAKITKTIHDTKQAIISFKGKIIFP